MKKKATNQAAGHLQVARYYITQAVIAANGGRAPAPHDTAELMQAWARITLAVKQPHAETRQIHANAQLEMLKGLTA